jgi:excinuclease ABC subunit C
MYSDNLQFEQAQIIKEKIGILKTYQSKSVIVSPKITDVDVFSVFSDGDVAFVNFIGIKSGSVIKTLTLKMKKKLNEKDEQLLRLAIVEIRQRFKSVSKNIYCSHNIKTPWSNINFSVPKIGDKRKLVDLSLKNAKQMFLNIKKSKINQLASKGADQILSQLQRDLNLKIVPKHIECFDNSNLQGTNPMSACVVFKNAKPSKKEYRCFNIKTVSGPDDYTSMEEVVYRRCLRLIDEKKKLPDLIIIDGGKGQLNSAIKSLKKLNILNNIAIIGIAKRLEEIYFPGDSVPLYLDKRSESLKLIQRLRDEAHRFSITKHRNKRSKNALKSSLDKVVGIGPKTMELLISSYGSVKNVRKAKKKDIITLIGTSKANKIFKN